MQKLADFIQRRRLKFVKAAPLFGISQSHLGNIVKGRRKLVMTEAEAWYFSQIIDLVEAGRHHELKQELLPADLVAIREELGLSMADAARVCGLDPSHWGHMERGDDPVTQRTGYQIQLKLMERRGELPAQQAKLEPESAKGSAPSAFDIQSGAPAAQPAATSAADHNREAEIAVLGGAILDSDALPRVLQLTPACFHVPAHRLIFAAIRDLHAQAEPVDFISVTDKLRAQDQLDRAGGSSYILSLVHSIPTTANIGHYVSIIARYAQERSGNAPPAPPLAGQELPAGLALDVTKGAVWAALLALLERFGGNLAEVQRINAELLARVEQLERDGGALVDARLQAEEQARAEMARRRAYIKECVSVLVSRLPGSSDIWYGRLWTSLHKAVGVSKLDDIQSAEQAERAIAWLQKEAKIYSVILPAYQPMLPGVAV
jgi:transcriptional regulator with XRE-family HTH domain